jgi:4-azaleucine resistance transporter AzlC
MSTAEEIFTQTDGTDFTEFKEGMRDGIPIGAGYFAVSFALGIAMRNAGMSWFEGFMLSFTNLASAGEYAAIQVIASSGSLLEMALMTFIADARYILMSCSLAQKLSPETSQKKRIILGFGITDEIFAISSSRKGSLNPFYSYGAMAVSILPWALGSAFGVVLGNILPVRIVSALSVALYGMFLAIIIPPSRKDRTVLVIVIAGFITSWLCGILPVISSLGSGTRIIILTVLISAAAAIIKPVPVRIKEETDA